MVNIIVTRHYGVPSVSKISIYIYGATPYTNGKWSVHIYMRVFHLHPQLSISIYISTGALIQEVLQMYMRDSHLHCEYFIYICSTAYTMELYIYLVGSSTCVDHAPFAYPAIHICPIFTIGIWSATQYISIYVE